MRTVMPTPGGMMSRPVCGSEGRDSHVARVAGSAESTVARSRRAYRPGPCEGRIPDVRELVQEPLSRVEPHCGWRHGGRLDDDVTQLDGFLSSLRPLLDAQGAHAAWIFGSCASGTASAESDIDVIVVAPTYRPFVDRFRDYLSAIANAGVGVDLLVYTPAEFARLQAEGTPFLVDALADAKQVYVGRSCGG